MQTPIFPTDQAFPRQHPGWDQPHFTPSPEPPGPFTANDLADLDPVAVDRCLPALVQALAAEHDDVALEAERLLTRHPLFALRPGPWPSPPPEPDLRHVLFPEAQIDAVAQALRTVCRAAPPSVRRRLVESLARLEGLTNVLKASELALSPEEHDHLDLLETERSLRAFPSQVTVVLNYQCNKHCSYCFSDAVSRQLPQPIAEARFLQVLDWARRSGASRVPVTGGEPTLHPEFGPLMQALRSRGFTTCFSTNGCGPQSSYAALAPDFVEAVTFHILDNSDYTTSENERLEENIRLVRDRGIPLIFRYVLTGQNPPAWGRYLELAERYRPGMMTFSPVFPGPGRQEASREVRGLLRAREPLLTLVRTALRLGAQPVLAKPIPLCMFTQAELLELTAVAVVKNVCDVSQNRYTNNTFVNPDGTLDPCMALPVTRADLESVPSLEAFANRSRQAVLPLQQRPMLEECPHCQLYQRRLCQPACLAFALPANLPPTPLAQGSPSSGLRP